MNYAEASYPFKDNPTPTHFQHIAAYLDAQRDVRKRNEARIMIDRRERARPVLRIVGGEA